MYEFRTKRRVEFADTDMAGIVHFARFFVFMETAEHQLLEHLGTPVHFEHAGDSLGWPRVAAACDYRSPARLGDLLQITVHILRKGRTSMTYGFDISHAERRVAVGRLSTICCALGEGSLRPVPIPAFLADQMQETPTELAAIYRTVVGQRS